MWEFAAIVTAFVLYLLIKLIYKEGVGVSPTYDDGYVLTACGSNSVGSLSVVDV